MHTKAPVPRLVDLLVYDDLTIGRTYCRDDAVLSTHHHALDNGLTTDGQVFGLSRFADCHDLLQGCSPGVRRAGRHEKG